jgi:hypothetical protein
VTAGIESFVIPKQVKTQVLNQQVAPTIIKALGYRPRELDAVREEGISASSFNCDND